MKMVAGVPLKFLGTGEKIDEIESFIPSVWPAGFWGREMLFLWWKSH